MASDIATLEPLRFGRMFGEEDTEVVMQKSHMRLVKLARRIKDLTYVLVRHSAAKINPTK